MPRLQIERVIAASPEACFDALTDAASWPDRVTGVVRTEVLDEGPVRDGHRLRETRVMFGREATETFTFRDVRRPSGHALESASCGTAFRFEYRLDAVREGCRVTMRGDWHATTAFGRIVGAVTGPLMKGAMVKAIEKDFDELKASIERDAAAS